MRKEVPPEAIESEAPECGTHLSRSSVLQGRKWMRAWAVVSGVVRTSCGFHRLPPPGSLTVSVVDTCGVVGREEGALDARCQQQERVDDSREDGMHPTAACSRLWLTDRHQPTKKHASHKSCIDRPSNARIHGLYSCRGCSGDCGGGGRERVFSLFLQTNTNRKLNRQVRALVAAENRAREEATVCAVYREALARELEGVFSGDGSLAGSSSCSGLFGERNFN